jgi:hypothetical protein
MSDEPMMGMSETPEPDSSPSGGVLGSASDLAASLQYAAVLPVADTSVTATPTTGSGGAPGGTGLTTRKSAKAVVVDASLYAPVQTISGLSSDATLWATAGQSSAAESGGPVVTSPQAPSLWYNLLTDPLSRKPLRRSS